MKVNILPIAGKYFNWWTSTLKSCLPAPAHKLFKKYNRDVELIIQHQKDGIYLQDGSGRVIDSISTIDIDDDNNEGLDVNLFEAQGEEEAEVDATHRGLYDRTEVIHHDFKRREPAISENELDEVDLTIDNDATIVLNRDDKTVRLLGQVSEDDTIVIQDDQGTLLNLDSDSSTGQDGDSTVLYYSDRGRIRAVEAKKDPALEQNIDFNLLTDNPKKEKQEATGEDFNLAAGLLSKYPGNKKCLYLIPDDQIFSLVLNYPVEVLENIENVLRYDLEKHIPLSFQEIRFFYALNIKSGTGKVDVEVIVIKSTVFDLLESAFDSERQREIICTTRYFYQHYGTKINMLGNRKGESRNTWLTVGNMHTAINVILLLGVFVLPYQLHYSQLAEIQPKSSAEISKAGKIVSTINQLNAEIQIGEKLNTQISKDRRMVELLAQLSEHIATDAWISRFSYKNGELKLKGEAVSATSVSDDLNNTGLFESIKFISSIIKNPNTKREAFELSLKVKSDA